MRMYKGSAGPVLLDGRPLNTAEAKGQRHAVEAPDRAELAQIKAALERADQERAELRMLLGAAQQLARALPAPAEAAPTQDEPAGSSMPPPEPPMPTRPWWRRWFAG